MTFRRLSGLAMLLLPVLYGCASAGVQEIQGVPAADPAGLAASLGAASRPEGPHQVNFAWTLEEGGSRARGRGVVRVDAPRRIRLDLFGPRGETYLVAALVGSEYRLPSSVSSPVALPSPSLLWAALGVFEPPSGAEISTAVLTEGGATVRYDAPEGNLYLFEFGGSESEGYRLASVERATSRGVLETVTIQRGEDGAVDRSDYRDWSAFRSLTLEVEANRRVDPFPTTIWRPDAQSR